MDKSDRIEQIYLIVGHIEGRMDNFGDLSKRVATLVAGQRGTARNGRESFQSLFRISNRLDPGFPAQVLSRDSSPTRIPCRAHLPQFRSRPGRVPAESAARRFS